MPNSNNVCFSNTRISAIESDVKVIKTQHLGLEKGLTELTHTMKQLINEMAKSRDYDHQLTLANALQLGKLEGLDDKVTALHNRLDKHDNRLDGLDRQAVTTDSTNKWVDRAVIGALAVVSGYVLKAVGLI